ncbi:hypothetical protein BYT27DRAFT_7151275 [Phlegmacium glaucopus]|nr:hypothetical protein BYT27DRAFT_7151275 [Phlegmacium glaucopus]
MPRTRKRKQPIVQTTTPSIAVQSCRATIRQYHLLLKRRCQLEQAKQTNALAEIDQQISSLGGIERYQKMSSLGQQSDRGGGSEKVFIHWMKGIRRTQSNPQNIRLLEVGALKPDNYRSCSSWIEWLPIDLNSRHPRIIQQDFLNMDLQEHESSWDAISLSLVVNFVPEPTDRGRMLQLAYRMLVPDGILFLALPLPCVANSRYLTFERLQLIMESIGFTQLQEKWRTGGKMAYWLYQKKNASTLAAHTFNKKVVLRQGHRNNFAIILDS